MNDLESGFIQAIQRDPEDDEARMVYADWLEQQGDVRGEYLRLEAQLRRIPPRLAELQRMISPGWLAMVGMRRRVVLLGGDNPIATIKIIRSITGLGLKDAKDLFDRARQVGRAVIRDDLDEEAARSIAKAFDGVANVQVERDAREPPPGELATGPIVSLVMVSVRPDRRIEAIRIIRELTGWGIADAKRFIDEVDAGTPGTIRLGAVEAAASALVARFQDVAQVRVERGPG